MTKMEDAINFHTKNNWNYIWLIYTHICIYMDVIFFLNMCVYIYAFFLYMCVYIYNTYVCIIYILPHIQIASIICGSYYTYSS